MLLYRMYSTSGTDDMFAGLIRDRKRFSGQRLPREVKQRVSVYGYLEMTDLT